jgi:hypothetical protein
MNEQNSSPPVESASSDLARFAKTSESQLQTLQADFLSEGSRKDQRLLLLIAFLLLFVSLGSIVIMGTEAKAFGDVKVSVTAPKNVIKLGFLICVFFELTYLVRVHADWTAYAIRRGLAEAELDVLSLEIAEPITPFAKTEEYRNYEVEKLRSRAFGGPQPDASELAKKREGYEAYMNRLARKKYWIDQHMSRVRTSVNLRTLIEVAFPLIFGAYALYEAFGHIIGH